MAARPAVRVHVGPYPEGVAPQPPGSLDKIVRSFFPEVANPGSPVGEDEARRLHAEHVVLRKQRSIMMLATPPPSPAGEGP